ncbi:MAG TPA: type IV toxin-antitoxin system AbiEi family antitoxin [Mycobacteriales bacterium]|nr:type IV toxin-antitoxin system AbiEi family antitoxin [Mycobacteriales bacterium]
MRTPTVPDALRHHPFTTSTAREHGVSSSALQGSAWRHVFREVWCHANLPDTRENRLAAVRLVLAEHAFVCGPTAAWLYGIDIQDRRSDLVWVGFPNGRRRRQRSGCFVRELTVLETDLAEVNGVRLTTPVRTVFDCARWLALVEAVVVADALAHAGLITREELAAYSSEHRRIRNVRQVDRVLELIEPASESPMETRVRLLLVRAGLPAPVAQHRVRGADGHFVARLDLAYPDALVAVEYDGSFHWQQRRADDRRREELRALGWTVLVVSAEDYFQAPDALVARVRRALTSARSTYMRV